MIAKNRIFPQEGIENYSRSRAIEFIRKHPALKGTTKSLARSLVDFAGNDGEIFPSIRKIVEDTGYSRRTVQTHLRKLEAMGILSTSERYTSQGDRTSNRYVLNIPSDDSFFNGDKLHGVAQDLHGVAQEMRPKHKENHKDKKHVHVVSFKQKWAMRDSKRKSNSKHNSSRRYICQLDNK